MCIILCTYIFCEGYIFQLPLHGIPCTVLNNCGIMISIWNKKEEANNIEELRGQFGERHALRFLFIFLCFLPYPIYQRIDEYFNKFFYIIPFFIFYNLETFNLKIKFFFKVKKKNSNQEWLKKILTVSIIRIKVSFKSIHFYILCPH